MLIDKYLQLLDKDWIVKSMRTVKIKYVWKQVQKVQQNQKRKYLTSHKEYHCEICIRFKGKYQQSQITD